MNPPRIHAPKAVAPAVEMFSNFLQSRIAEGAEFKIGHAIQCSWMWFKVGTDERGQPTVLAPQTGVMPMNFVADSSDALNLILTQRYVCDSFSVQCGWCNAAQSAIVIKDLAGCKSIFMNRTEQEDGRTSGWFFGAADSKLDSDDVHNLELKSLWQLSCELPESRDFFLLPQGWQVVFEDRPVVLRDFKVASALPTSYYAARYQS
jgi:hypothetical protein